jgi:hypothetical protein
MFGKMTSGVKQFTLTLNRLGRSYLAACGGRIFDDPQGNHGETKMLNVSNTVVAASLLFLVQGAAGPPSGSDGRRIVLTNNTQQTIAEIYVSDDDGTDSWQEDLLGSEFLLPGGSVIVDVDDRNGNCIVDIKTVLNNGSDLIKRGLNACRQAVLIR